jgi:hypothetical protein
MKSKQELIDYVAHQLNITLENNKNDILNDRRKILHTTITKANRTAVLSLLTRKGIRYENHVKDYYFIYI